jgi:hypothetical protein
LTPHRIDRSGCGSIEYWAERRAAGVRRTFSRQNHSLGQLIRHLDQIARSMNPFLAAVVIVLVILNFALVVNLIDWRDLPETPPAEASPSAATVQAPAKSPGSAAVPSPRIATPAD